VCARISSPGKSRSPVVDEILAVDDAKPARPRDAGEFRAEEPVVLNELGIVRAVPHVRNRIVVDVEPGERRRVDGKIDARIRQLPDYVDAIPVIRREPLAVSFSHAVNHAILALIQFGSCAE
jgi:hypothetical protein